MMVRKVQDILDFLKDYSPDTPVSGWMDEYCRELECGIREVLDNDGNDTGRIHLFVST